MRRSLLALLVLAVLVFSIGYVVGQNGSHTTPSAAAATENLSVSNLAATDPPVRPSWAHPFSGTRIFGRISKISGSFVTVSLPNHLFGPLERSAINQIQITAGTKVYTGHDVSTSPATLKVGSFVAATGTLTNQNTVVKATDVLVFSQPRMGMVPDRFSLGAPRVTGKVTAVTGNTLSITPNIGWWTRPLSVNRIVVTASTHYVSGPFQAASRSSIHVGSIVSVSGTLSSNGKTMTASTLNVEPATPHMVQPGMFGIHGSQRMPRLFSFFRQPLAEGKVTAISGSNPTVLKVESPALFDTAGSLVYVDVSSKTQYLSGLDTKSSLPAIKVGSFIVASGTTSKGSKTLTASTVRLLPGTHSFALGLRGLGLHGLGLHGLGLGFHGLKLHALPFRWLSRLVRSNEPIFH